MGDLFLDNIEDQHGYPDTMILRDVRQLLAAGIREGPMLDYKSDISDKDNWPEAVASFANSFGGLIVFGAEGKGDQPRRLIGFDGKGIETKTRIGSTLLSRIQPRPQFQIRVLTFDDDPSREVALVRVPEGQSPPYMHSRAGEHRVFIRVGAQKAEADYLQLMSLFQKRTGDGSEANSILTELTVGSAQVVVPEPGTTNSSSHWYRFLVIPEDRRAARKLTLAIEQQLTMLVDQIFGGNQGRGPVIRTQGLSVFPRGAGTLMEHRFGVTSSGSLVFASRACIQTQDGPFFVPRHFCWDLMAFLCVAALFYAKAGYFGGCVLYVSSVIGGAQLYRGVPTRNNENGGSDLFDPPLEQLDWNGSTQTPVVPYRVTSERLAATACEVVNDLVRISGHVTVPDFDTRIKWLADMALERYQAAHQPS